MSKQDSNLQHFLFGQTLEFFKQRQDYLRVVAETKALLVLQTTEALAERGITGDMQKFLDTHFISIHELIHSTKDEKEGWDKVATLYLLT